MVLLQFMLLAEFLGVPSVRHMGVSRIPAPQFLREGWDDLVQYGRSTVFLAQSVLS